jgi:hypothetical protein
VTDQAAADSKGRSFKELAATAAAVVAAVGAVWFGAVSLLSAWVYEPVGVSPRDLGLSSSAILVQATVGLVVSVVFGVVVGTLAGGIWGAWRAGRDSNMLQLADQVPLPFTSDDPVSNEAAVAGLRREVPNLSQEEAEQFVRAVHDSVTRESVAELRASAPADVSDETLAEIASAIHREVPRAQIRAMAVLLNALMGATYGLCVALVGCLIAVAWVASESRDAIEAGRATGFVLGLPAPWSATVAEVHSSGNAPAQGTPDALPPCALFLGQHDSTVFLRDGSARTTIRVPASTVRLDLRDLDRCP